jgi:hypothetical protein
MLLHSWRSWRGRCCARRCSTIGAASARTGWAALAGACTCAQNHARSKELGLRAPAHLPMQDVAVVLLLEESQGAGSARMHIHCAGYSAPAADVPIKVGCLSRQGRSWQSCGVLNNTRYEQHLPPAGVGCWWPPAATRGQEQQLGAAAPASGAAAARGWVRRGAAEQQRWQQPPPAGGPADQLLRGSQAASKRCLASR